MKIAIGADHGGYKLKEEIKKYLEEKGIEYKDFGTNSEERVDYPVIAKNVCKSIQNKEADLGVVICKTGYGMSIVANKFKKKYNSYYVFIIYNLLNYFFKIKYCSSKKIIKYLGK